MGLGKNDSTRTANVKRELWEEFRLICLNKDTTRSQVLRRAIINFAVGALEIEDIMREHTGAKIGDLNKRSFITNEETHKYWEQFEEKLNAISMTKTSFYTAFVKYFIKKNKLTKLFGKTIRIEFNNNIERKNWFEKEKSLLNNEKFNNDKIEIIEYQFNDEGVTIKMFIKERNYSLIKKYNEFLRTINLEGINLLLKKLKLD